jgi:hypothetical protein
MGEYDNMTGVGTENSLTRNIARPYYLLRANSEYRLYFADVLHRLCFNDGILVPENVTARWVRLSEEVTDACVGESARWGDYARDNAMYPDPNANVCMRDTYWLVERDRMLNDYFPLRTERVMDQFRNIDLYPDLDAAEFGVNSVRQHGGSVRPTDLISIEALSGTIYYTLDGSDPRLPGITVDDVERITTTLVAEDAVKKALVPSVANGGNLLDNSWRADPNFDDSGWRSGTLGIGYEEGSGYNAYFDIDTLSEMADNHPTCFVRILFEVDGIDLAEIDTMTLKVRYDDGFSAYLGGVQVASQNAPASPVWDSSATGGHSDGESIIFQKFDITEHIADLQAGETNLLAIYGLNNGVGSSDFLISATLDVASVIEHGTPGSTPPSVSATAILYEAPISLTDSARIKARVIGSGEWSALTDATFEVITAGTGDIIISELFPNAVGNDDFKEWFEVYNTTGAPIDINGWVISDNEADAHTIDNAGPLLVPAKGYLVLGESVDSGVNGGAPVDYAYGVDSITLGNGGDEIILSQAGETIHAIGYGDFDNGPTAVVDVGLESTPGVALGMAKDYCEGAVTFWAPQTSVYGSDANIGTPGKDNDGVNMCGGVGAVSIWRVY